MGLNIKNSLLFLSGFFSIITAIKINILGLNIRLSNLTTVLLLLTFLICLYANNNRLKLEISKYTFFFVIAILSLFNFIWLIDVIRSILYVTDEAYANFSFLFWINNIFPLVIYLFLMMFLRKESFFFFFKGFLFANILNSIIIIVFYIKLFLFNDVFTLENILPSIFSIDEKAKEIFNQNLARYSGLCIDPNYTATFMGLAFILSKYFIKNRLFNIFFSFLFLTIIFLLFSRTAIFSLILTLFIYIFIKEFKFIKPYLYYTLTVVFITLSLLLKLSDYNLSSMSDIYDRITLSDSSAGTRMLYISYFIKNLDPEVLIFGTGASASGYFFRDLFINRLNMWFPESTSLSLLIEHGIVFFGIFLILIIFTLKKLYEKNYKIFSMGLMYIIISSNFYNFSSDKIFLLYIIMSIYLAFLKK